MRNTKQKELIFNIVSNSFDHLSADKIYLKARKVLSNISLGTVYRNLNQLVEEGKIKKIKMNDKDCFDNLKEKHNHFICKKCQKIIDVKDKIDLSHKIENNLIVDYEINFIGICEDCLNKEEKYGNGRKTSL